MEIEQTGLKDCVIITPRIFEDARGAFFESFNRKAFEDKTGMSGNFVQDNQSISTYGVIRGLHAQSGKFAQAKLVRVLEGEVLDVAVDIRLDSSTFGKKIAVKLSAENKKQLYVPRGFLHGFSVLSERAVFFYKCDNLYNKQSEIGVVYNDPHLSIDWLIPEDKELVSDKDLVLANLSSLHHG